MKEQHRLEFRQMLYLLKGMATTDIPIIFLGDPSLNEHFKIEEYGPQSTLFKDVYPLRYTSEDRMRWLGERMPYRLLKDLKGKSPSEEVLKQRTVLLDAIEEGLRWCDNPEGKNPKEIKADELPTILQNIRESLGLAQSNWAELIRSRLLAWKSTWFAFEKEFKILHRDKGGIEILLELRERAEREVEQLALAAKSNPSIGIGETATEAVKLIREPIGELEESMGKLRISKKSYLTNDATATVEHVKQATDKLADHIRKMELMSQSGSVKRLLTLIDDYLGNGANFHEWNSRCKQWKETKADVDAKREVERQELEVHGETTSSDQESSEEEVLGNLRTELKRTLEEAKKRTRDFFDTVGGLRSELALEVLLLPYWITFEACRPPEFPERAEGPNGPRRMPKGTEKAVVPTPKEMIAQLSRSRDGLQFFKRPSGGLVRNHFERAKCYYQIAVELTLSHPEVEAYLAEYPKAESYLMDRMSLPREVWLKNDRSMTTDQTRLDIPFHHQDGLDRLLGIFHRYLTNGRALKERFVKSKLYEVTFVDRLGEVQELLQVHGSEKREGGQKKPLEQLVDQFFFSWSPETKDHFRFAESARDSNSLRFLKRMYGADGTSGERSATVEATLLQTQDLMDLYRAMSRRCSDSSSMAQDILNHYLDDSTRQRAAWIHLNQMLETHREAKEITGEYAPRAEWVKEAYQQLTETRTHRLGLYTIERARFRPDLGLLGVVEETGSIPAKLDHIFKDVAQNRVDRLAAWKEALSREVFSKETLQELELTGNPQLLKLSRKVWSAERTRKLTRRFSRLKSFWQQLDEEGQKMVGHHVLAAREPMHWAMLNHLLSGEAPPEEGRDTIFWAQNLISELWRKSHAIVALGELTSLIGQDRGGAERLAWRAQKAVLNVETIDFSGPGELLSQRSDIQDEESLFAQLLKSLMRKQKTAFERDQILQEARQGEGDYAKWEQEALIYIEDKLIELKPTAGSKEAFPKYAPSHLQALADLELPEDERSIDILEKYISVEDRKTLNDLKQRLEENPTPERSELTRKSTELYKKLSEKKRGLKGEISVALHLNQYVSETEAATLVHAAQETCTTASKDYQDWQGDLLGGMKGGIYTTDMSDLLNEHFKLEPKPEPVKRQVEEEIRSGGGDWLDWERAGLRHLFGIEVTASEDETTTKEPNEAIDPIGPTPDAPPEPAATSEQPVATSEQPVEQPNEKPNTTTEQRSDDPETPDV